MKKVLLPIFSILLLAAASPAQTDKPLLMRNPTLSKTHIIFSYAGDLWIVPREGGDAARLTQVGQRGRVTVGTLQSLAGGLLASVIAGFHTAHPDVELFVRSGHNDLIVEMLRRSEDPEDTLAQQKDRLNRLVQQVRRQGYASRARHVEPKNSNTIAVPIMNEAGRVVASFGLTYFTAALSEAEACERYVPVLKSTSAEITQDLARITRTSFG